MWKEPSRRRQWLVTKSRVNEEMNLMKEDLLDKMLRLKSLHELESQKRCPSAPGVGS